MATTTTNISTATKSPFGVLAKVGNAILSGFDAIAQANSRVAQFEYLNSKSDEELAKMGMERTDIARQLFLDQIA